MLFIDDTFMPNQPPKPALLVRSAAFWLVFLLSTLIFAPLALLTFPFPFKVRHGFISLWSRLNLWWLEKSCKLSYNLQGMDNVKVPNGIVFSKHQSTWETLFLQQLFKPETWVLKKELLKVPFFGWGARLVEPIALDRGAGRRAIDQLIEQGRDRLEKGRWVIIFPEGTRMPPGIHGRYKIGGAALAEATGYPVIPIAHNAGEYWPRRGFIKKPGVIQVRVGKPIETRGRKAQDILKEAEDWIESQMKEITTLKKA